MSAITPDDDHSHKPNGDEKWQESWAFSWFDPITRVAGYHHTGMQRGRGIADCWSWFAVGGQLVYRFNDNQMVLPADDYTNMKIGPLQVRSLVPNVKREVTYTGEGCTGSVIYEAFRKEPIVLHKKKTKGSYFDEISSDGHYETMGTVKGSLDINGRRIEINGLGYDDRSWGARAWGSLHYRVFWANFGPDFYLIAYHVATDKGGTAFGWVCENGTFREVVALDFCVNTNIDGVTARGGSVRLWTEDRSGLVIDIVIDGQSVITQRDGFMCSPGIGIATCGGHLGAAMLEFSEMKHPTHAVAERFGLDVPSPLK